MEKHILPRIAIFGLSLAVGNGIILEAQVPVEIIGVPSGADSVFVLADSEELASPLEAFARLLESTPFVRLSLPSTTSKSLQIRAVAFGGSSVFPTVEAI